MTMERIRLGVAAIWLFAALYIATDLHVSWTTGPILIVLGLVPPMAIFGWWNESKPLLAKRSCDPRSS